jgi:hypothetical protein
MSRALFIAKLKEGLAGLPQAEIEEIASDYEFHFDEATATGEIEDDIVARLGDPTRLARELRGGLEQRLTKESAAAVETLAPPPRLGARAGLLLAVLAVSGMAAAAYHFSGRDIGPTTPAAIQRTVTVPPAGAKLVIAGGQQWDLGTLAQDRVEIVVDGGGQAIARGRVKELILHIDGSGSADFGALQADIVRVELSGTGQAHVSGTQAVDITISGSGSVRLKVKPKTLKQSITGSGQVILPS